jgi:hypothetical protein
MLGFARRSRGRGQRHRPAAKELTEEVQGRTPLLPARPFSGLQLVSRLASRSRRLCHVPQQDTAIAATGQRLAVGTETQRDGDAHRCHDGFPHFPGCRLDQKNSRLRSHFRFHAVGGLIRGVTLRKDGDPFAVRAENRLAEPVFFGERNDTNNFSLYCIYQVQFLFFRLWMTASMRPSGDNTGA